MVKGLLAGCYWEWRRHLKLLLWSAHVGRFGNSVPATETLNPKNIPCKLGLPRGGMNNKHCQGVRCQGVWQSSFRHWIFSSNAFYGSYGCIVRNQGPPKSNSCYHKILLQPLTLVRRAKPTINKVTYVKPVSSLHILLFKPRRPFDSMGTDHHNTRCHPEGAY